MFVRLFSIILETTKEIIGIKILREIWVYNLLIFMVRLIAILRKMFEFGFIATDHIVYYCPLQAN